MINVRLDEFQVGIKISRRNINNLRYVDDTTLMTESKEELKTLLMRVKEESKRKQLRLYILKNKQTNKQTKPKIMTSGPNSARQEEGEKVEAVTDFLFLGSKITVDCDCSHEIRRQLLLGRKATTNLDSVLENRDITLLIEVYSQGYGFPSVHVWL